MKTSLWGDGKSDLFVDAWESVQGEMARHDIGHKTLIEAPEPVQNVLEQDTMAIEDAWSE